MASDDFDVTILEKNTTIGGRCRVLKENGFTFDMGPSWYWMPDIYDTYFEEFGKKTSDYYILTRLDPSYKVILKDKKEINLPANINSLKVLFEQLEPGCGLKFDSFLKESEYKYKVGIGEFVWKPSLSIEEFFDFRLLSKAISLDFTIKCLQTYISSSRSNIHQRDSQVLYEKIMLQIEGTKAGHSVTDVLGLRQQVVGEISMIKQEVDKLKVGIAKMRQILVKTMN